MTDPLQPALRIDITPAPTADERDAIVAALAVLTMARTAAGEVAVAAPSTWALTARREATRSQSSASASGWGRTRPGWGRGS